MKVEGYDIKYVDICSDSYPELLRNISDPPERLYYAGDWSVLEKPGVAVVGSRKFTVYGKTVAKMIGQRFAESGIAVISGLAYGIDSFAHEGTMDSRGSAVAVLGGGLKQMSPAKNRNLMRQILDNGGLIVSEYNPDFPPQPWTFPRRNRIISGLSRIVCVIEANFNSGALITAQYAAEQGRLVYAVPGNINSQFSMGSNLLIRDGANALVVFDDVVRELGLKVGVKETDSVKLGEDEQLIADIVKSYNGVSVDIIAGEVNMRIQSVNAILTVLEIKGVVKSSCGKYFTNC